MEPPWLQTCRPLPLTLPSQCKFSLVFLRTGGDELRSSGPATHRGASVASVPPSFVTFPRHSSQRAACIALADSRKSARYTQVCKDGGAADTSSLRYETARPHQHSSHQLCSSSPSNPDSTMSSYNFNFSFFARMNDTGELYQHYSLLENPSPSLTRQTPTMWASSCSKTARPGRRLCSPTFPAAAT